MEGPQAAIQETFPPLLFLAKALASIENSFPYVKGKEPINMCERANKHANFGIPGENIEIQEDKGKINLGEH